MPELYLPTFEDLWFRQNLLDDDKTMSYNHAYGGRIDFSKSKWEKWYDFWVQNTENKRFYRYLKKGTIFLGEASYHYDDEKEIYLADILIFYPYRKKGFGTQGLQLLCQSAKENGINTLYDNIAADNPSVSLFLKNGFTEAERNEEYVLVKKQL